MHIDNSGTNPVVDTNAGFVTALTSSMGLGDVLSHGTEAMINTGIKGVAGGFAGVYLCNSRAAQLGIDTKAKG
jgi:hypothetical protein